MPPPLDELVEADLDLRGFYNQVRPHPSATLAFQAARQRRILLIHGCNTSERNGQKRTRAMRDALVKRCPGLKREVLSVTWPGDVRWSLGGLLRYKQMTRRADEAGDTLQRYLEQEFRLGGGSNELVIVAHSLGCRLALQMACELAKTPQRAGLEKIVLILMGAAVAVDRLDLFNAVGPPLRVVVLHSARDHALTAWFPRGQYLAGEGYREAVGAYGNPRAPVWATLRPMRDYDHDDYWRRPETVDAVADELRTSFGLKFGDDPGRENRIPQARDIPATAPVAIRAVGDR